MPNPSREEPTADPPVLAALQERIRAQALAGREWGLQASELPGLLGLRSADYYRRLYAAERSGNRLVNLGSASGRYSQENVGELVSLLELFCGSAAESSLRELGVFFPHPEQVEIMDRLLGEVGEALGAHRLEEAQFSAMLRAFGGFERARRVYREEHFPLEGLLDRAADRYCAGRSFGLPELARLNVRRLLEFFFRKHVLEAESLFASLYERLREQAVREGYLPRQPEAERRAGRAAREELTPAASARRLLDLEEGELDRRRLKSRYKTLMKIYQPDLNPQGLRRCQEINAAYALLLSGLPGV